MRVNLTNGRLVIRFTLNFILHQLLLFLVVSLPAIFYIVVLKRPDQLLIINLATGTMIAAYFLYCLFYGYYVARPMADILVQLRKLSRGEYLLPAGKRPSFSSRLYREVYANLEALSSVLQDNERRRRKFEQERQDWAAGVTHDLKTPLSYISGYTEMLLSDGHVWSEDEKREFLLLIREKSAHMEELIHDLGLTFRMDQSAAPKLSLRRIELGELIRRTVAETANLPLDRSARFEIRGGEEPLHITGDAELLKRAFSNLLVNAVVHNPPGTSITVHIRRASQAEIQITDNGTGLDEDQLNRLFERYYRGTSTAAPAGGTGLGMAIVKQIVTAHQGTVEVSSRPGHGTAVTVCLPFGGQSNA